MAQSIDSRRPTRRRLVQLLGIAAGGGAVQWLRGASGASGASGAGDDETDADPSFVLAQGDRCVPIEPLQGDEPVEELYDYTYPKDRYQGPPGSQGSSFSSEGTTDLQRDRTSIMFLYDGPEGLSLVVVHGHVGGSDDEGGTVTFTFQGMPESATWVVRDDYYLEDGEQADSNYDRWDVDDDPHVIDWAYVAGRTDGGAVRGLGTAFDITLAQAFNDEATLGGDHDFGPIENWEVLSGEREDVDRYELRLDQRVRIRAGECQDHDDGTPTETDDDDDTVVVTVDTDDNVETDGAVRIGEGVELDGNVEAGGPVELDPGAVIDGNVETAGAVTLGPDSEIDGNVEAGDDVTVGRDAEIDGNVESSDAVTVEADAEIVGNVTGASVDVADSGEIDGSVVGIDL